MPTKQRRTSRQNLPVPVEVIERNIYLVRAQKVMLDADLARLYQVSTKAFNQAVKRYLERFPDDFMFQLIVNEARNLRSHSVTSRPDMAAAATCPSSSRNTASLCFLPS